MGCCGGDEVDTSIPIGIRQPNDVLAQALWGGNHSEHGRATGRWYPRMGHPRVTWVDPRDVERSPGLWKQITEQPPSGNGNGLAVFDRIFHHPSPQVLDMAAPPLPSPAPVPETAPPFHPNVGRVVRLARERLG